jgi:predicted MPP superfamily phosphohydrolase
LIKIERDCLNRFSAPGKMKIQFASDLHLECFNYYTDGEEVFRKLLEKDENADILILAGDIGYPESPITERFFAWCCELWPHVVWIYGNHEYYSFFSYFEGDIMTPSYTMSQKEKMSEKYKKFTNLSVLFSDTVRLEKFPGIRIIGTTLWTDIPSEEVYPVSRFMNDFNYICVEDGKTFTTDKWTELHTQQYKFIEDQLKDAEEKNEKVVVVTHHLPSYKMCLPQYKDSPVNSGFMTNADELLEHPSVAVWICGHSHGYKTEKIMKRNSETILCYLNARGYPREKNTQGYNPKLCIEV